MSAPRDESTGSTSAAGPETEAAGIELRRSPRFPLQRAALVIPVLPDGSPDWARRTTAQAQDLSLHGLGLECVTADLDDVPALLVGVCGRNDVLQYGGLVPRHTWRPTPEKLHLGGQFGGAAHTMLQPGNLIPEFRPQSLDFGLDVSEELLRKWEEIGVMQSGLVDRVQLCPRCLGPASFRPGCRRCGSARTHNDRLVHHFACAHVGPVEQFEHNGTLVCPKCRTRRLVVGSDFEYLKGPYRCAACQWSDTELEQVAQCLRCRFRFPGHQAVVRDLIGYHVNRLDPLALLPNP